MDVPLFKAEHPGSLVPIGGGEFAFHPWNLPPADFELDTRLWKLYADATKGLGEVRGLTGHGKGTNISLRLLIRTLQRQEALRSSSLEGTYTDPTQLVFFELAPEREGGAKNKDENRVEVNNARKSLELGEGLLREQGLNHWVIRSIHQALLSGVRGDEKSPGSYRDNQVYIGSDARFIPPPGHLVAQCMQELIDYCNAPTDDLPPLIRAFLVHYQFETIHPFRDGNGRVGRVLLSLMIGDWCNLRRPWIYLSEFFETHRSEYIDLLFGVSARACWSDWIAFCLRATVQQSKKTVDRISGLLDLRASWDDAVREAGLPHRCFDVLDSLLSIPAITGQIASGLMGVTLNTAKSDLQSLEELGILRRVRGSRPLLFYTPAVQTTIENPPESSD